MDRDRQLARVVAIFGGWVACAVPLAFTLPRSSAIVERILGAVFLSGLFVLMLLPILLWTLGAGSAGKRFSSLLGILAVGLVAVAAFEVGGLPHRLPFPRPRELLVLVQTFFQVTWFLGAGHQAYRWTLAREVSFEAPPLDAPAANVPWRSGLLAFGWTALCFGVSGYAWHAASS